MSIPFPCWTFLLLLAMCSPIAGFSQGWVAEIDIDLNHNLYAYEKISNAQMTYSGVTVSASSSTSQLHLVMEGPGEPSGVVSLKVSGEAFEPYDNNLPYTKVINLTLSANHTESCATGFYSSGKLDETIYLWITLNRRTVLANLQQECEKFMLTSSTCANDVHWEIAESISGPFYTLSAQTPTLNVHRDDLLALNFRNPFGRKYLRATGVPGTTSELFPVEIYYPGPRANLASFAPRCHDGSDGQVDIEILSAAPESIDDFVITLFDNDKNPIRQIAINNTSAHSFKSLSPGKYGVRIQNNSSIGTLGSCWNDFSPDPVSNPKPVTIDKVLLSDYNGFQISCHNNEDGSIKINALGGTGAFENYEWTPAVSTTDYAEGLSSGPYQVRVSDSNNCWSEKTSVELSAPPAISVFLKSIGGKNGFDVSCHDAADGILEVEIDGGVKPHSIRWSNDSREWRIPNLSAGSYSFNVVDGNGCSKGEAIELKAPLPIEVSIRQTSEIKCPGASTGSIEVHEVVNAIGEVSYEWSSGETDWLIFGKPSGKYTLKVKDQQGCNGIDSIVLVDPEAHRVRTFSESDFNGSPIRCNGERNGILNAELIAPSGIDVRPEHVKWFRENLLLQSGSETRLEAVGAGIYKVVLEYDGSCLSESMYELKEPEALSGEVRLSSNYNGSTISCFGGRDAAVVAIAKGGIGDYYFQWEDGFSGSERTELGAGNYSVTISDINGCQDTASILIANPPKLEARIAILSNYHGQPLSCTGANDARIKAIPTGGTGNYSFQWRNGPSQDQLNGVAAGNYGVIVRDANACEAESTITITDPEKVSAFVEDRSDFHGYGVTCTGNADGFLRVSGRGGTGKYFYQWRDNDTAANKRNNLRAGTYYVEVSDENQCTVTLEETITEPEPLKAVLGKAIHATCFGDENGRVTILAEGGQKNYTFSQDAKSWTGENEFERLHAGRHLFYVRDGNLCQSSISAEIKQPTPVAVSLENVTLARCGYAEGSASITATGGHSHYTYEWKDGEGRTIATTSKIENVAGGRYTAIARDSAFCSAELLVPISSTDGPKIDSVRTSTTTCANSTDGTALLHLSGATPFTVIWPNGEHGTEAYELGIGDHLVTIIDSLECSTFEIVSITGPDSIRLQSKKSDPSCHGECDGEINILATGGTGPFEYYWNDNPGLSQNRKDLCSGSYDLTVTDSSGCSASVQFSLTDPAPLEISSIETFEPTCRGSCDGAISIDVSGEVGTVRWQDPFEDGVARGLCAGEHTIIVSDSLSCSAQQTITLQDPDRPTLELGAGTTLCKGQSMQLDPGSQWTNTRWVSNTGFESSEQRVLISQAGWYSLTATDPWGCFASDTFNLYMSDDLLKAKFLMATEAIKNDTVVMIDISWPVPEKIFWKFPHDMIQLDAEGDIVSGKFETTGSYEITLTAMLGSCVDSLSKTISVVDVLAFDGDTHQRIDPPIKLFEIYPNPNEGRFEARVILRESGTIRLSAWNTSTARQIFRETFEGRSDYNLSINLGDIPRGPYTLRLDHSSGPAFIKFIVR